jgi:hypothetical protein
VRFEQVITSEHLLVEFCDALPGETLGALERAKGTLYFRVTGGSECEAWKFAPLSPGAPLGTLRRETRGGGPKLALHYWQAAEEISLFGPASDDPPSKPSDEREWACRTNYKLVGSDASSLELESGRWFFTESACRTAPESANVGGCVATLASGGG